MKLICFVIVGFAAFALTACGDPLNAGCTALDNCKSQTATTPTTTASNPSAMQVPNMQAVREGVEASLARAGYTRSAAYDWVKENDQVHLTEALGGGEYVMIKFAEGSILCDNIGANAAGFDPVGYVNELRAKGYAKVLEMHANLCKAV